MRASCRPLSLHLYQWGKPPEDIGPWYVEETKKWCAKNEGVILVAEHAKALLGYATILTKCESDGTSDEIALHLRPCG